MTIEELSMLMRVCGLLLEKDQELVTVSEAIGLLVANETAVALAIERLSASDELAAAKDRSEPDPCPH